MEDIMAETRLEAVQDIIKYSKAAKEKPKTVAKPAVKK